MDRNNEKAFNRVCDMVYPGHGGPDKPGRESPVKTLNALFQKHIRGRKKEWLPDLPDLSSDNVQVSIEFWSKEELWELAKRESSRLPHPQYMHLPLVLVRYRDRNCLIDGGSRVNAWHKAGETGTHPVCVLTVHE